WHAQRTARGTNDKPSHHNQPVLEGPSRHHSTHSQRRRGLRGRGNTHRVADCGSLSRPRSAISSRARPRSGGYISQFAARRPNPRQTAPKRSLNDGRTGEGSVSQRLRPATASSVRPKTT
ncbi:hypothetical protein FOZ63_005805, partial [Perkinsus olseni]